MDVRSIQSHQIAHEFKLDPYFIEENWGDFQIAQTISFIMELYKKK